MAASLWIFTIRCATLRSGATSLLMPFAKRQLAGAQAISN
jgi:hypothetical protein